MGLQCNDVAYDLEGDVALVHAAHQRLGHRKSIKALRSFIASLPKSERPGEQHAIQEWWNRYNCSVCNITQPPRRRPEFHPRRGLDSVVIENGSKWIVDTNG